ncbi:thiol-disulfide oxidoreductase DCC family protein [Mangrovimonas sp. YM274]|uniref:thiol-disulfide oxidoreductase DCC family protein n=1 Tax=Mangrovimonas sp. YM274 TaxID=3070660 RepID=UPI0027DBEB67|nr:thiol-disulfide oxidoreductase DCC family protein [Mangrovimonas sp. YM274]WMI67372.1 thiol-disulfide oxidoreductase DCC family protein [Mangrovimonas sp. YM274]
MTTLPKNKELILFDGVCNLCNTSIQYVIKHDKQNRFMFAALQSDIGKSIIEKHGIDTAKIDSILLHTPSQKIYYKSTAALKIASKLGFPTTLLAVFLIVPSFIRNWVYDIIAKNRYKWFGKQDSCMIPTPELTSKFLS